MPIAILTDIQSTRREIVVTSRLKNSLIDGSIRLNQVPGGTKANYNYCIKEKICRITLLLRSNQKLWSTEGRRLL